MNNRTFATFALVSALWTAAFAQTGAKITAIGSMDVEEGGSAHVMANVVGTGTGGTGRLVVNFDTGEFRKVYMDGFEDFFANFFTGAVSGRCTVNLVRNGRFQRVSGYCVVMMNDFDLIEETGPDSIFVHFTADGTGETIVRHGSMVRGDVAIDAD